MKHLALFAIALAFSFNASAGVYCVNQKKSVAVVIEGDGNTQSIAKTNVRVEVANSKTQGSLDLQAFLYLSKTGKMVVLAGDPNNGIDLEVNSLGESMNTLNYNSSLNLTLSGNFEQIKVGCINQENILN